MNMTGLTRALADPTSKTSLSAMARRRRWQAFQRKFPDLGEMSVLDLGGTADYWSTAPERPGSLVLLNLFDQPLPWDDGVRVVVGDACRPPAELKADRFDLVVSNSVIGSVGGHAKRRELAEVVHVLAPRHWIQTPSRWFPIDPVFLFPGYSMLPFAARVAVSRHWPLGHRQAESPDAALELVLSIESLTAAELRHYFPASDIWHERVAGVTKSIVAVRS
jgi:hypothetical protein